MSGRRKHRLFGALLASVGVTASCRRPRRRPHRPLIGPMFGLNTQIPLPMDVSWEIPPTSRSNGVTTGGDVSARAAVVNWIVYFPDWVPPGSGSTCGQSTPTAGRWSGGTSLRTMDYLQPPIRAPVRQSWVGSCTSDTGRCLSVGYHATTGT